MTMSQMMMMMMMINKYYGQVLAVSQETPTDVQISADLNDSERQEVRNLVNEFPDVFTDKPGFTDLLEHEIKTTTDTPIRLKLYPLPFAMTDVVSDEIETC